MSVPAPHPQKTAQELYEEQWKLRNQLAAAFDHAGGFQLNQLAADLQREPSPQEIVDAWLVRLWALGHEIHEQGLAGKLAEAYHPRHPQAAQTKILLLHASRQPNDTAGLKEMLKLMNAEAQIHQIKYWVQQAGWALLEATTPVEPARAPTAAAVQEPLAPTEPKPTADAVEPTPNGGHDNLPDNLPRTPPLQVNQLATMFGRERKAMGEMLRSGEIRCKKINRRSWVVAVADLPAKH